MTTDTFEPWRQAATLAELGVANAGYFVGDLPDHPGGPFTGETHPVEFPGVAGLALPALNRAGFVTLDYLHGGGSHSSRWRQRAAIQGFCDTVTLEWLTSALYGTAYQVLAQTSVWHRRAATTDGLNRGIPVARRGYRATAWFGRQLTEIDVAEETFGGVLSDDAVVALSVAWNVTVFDPDWGCNTLWTTLARAADPGPMLLARRREYVPTT